MVKYDSRARGFTLIEIMVGMTIALIMSSAAVMFATQETRLLSRTREQLEVQQSARAALSFIARDLRKAGTSIGYRMGGTGDSFFGGLVHGDFSLGGVQFTSAENDMLVSFATGPSTTIAFESVRNQADELRGFSCRQLTGAAGALAVVFDSARLASVVGTYASVGTRPSNTAEGRCNCIYNQCVDFTLTTATGLSSPSALQAPFGSGEIVLEPTSVAWFIGQDNETGSQVLRRFSSDYEVDPASAPFAGCDRNTCGGIVAYDIEDVNYRIWEFSQFGGGWQIASTRNNSLGTVYNTANPLRVDIEVVARSSRAVAGPTPSPNTFDNTAYQQDASACSPAGPCPGGDDDYYRSVMRTSVHILNSGFDGSVRGLAAASPPPTPPPPTPPPEEPTTPSPRPEPEPQPVPPGPPDRCRDPSRNRHSC